MLFVLGELLKGQSKKPSPDPRANGDLVGHVIQVKR